MPGACGLRLAFSRPVPACRLHSAHLSRKARLRGFCAQTLLNYDQARNWRTQARSGASPSPLLPPQAQPYYKILVNGDGLYQLSYTDLKNAGVPVDSLDPRKLRLFKQDNEVAISVEGEQDGTFNTGDVLLFYGQKAGTKFTYTNVYWLGWGTSDGLRMEQPNGAPAGGATVPASFKITQESNRIRITNPPTPAALTKITGIGI